MVRDTVVVQVSERLIQVQDREGGYRNSACSQCEGPSVGPSKVRGD